MYSKLELYILRVPGFTSHQMAQLDLMRRVMQLTIRDTRCLTSFGLGGSDQQILGLNGEYLVAIISRSGLYAQWMWLLAQVEGVSAVEQTFYELEVPQFVQNDLRLWQDFLDSVNFRYVLTGQMSQMELE